MKHWAPWWSFGLAGQAPYLTQKLGLGCPYLWGHILKRTPLNCVWGVSQECLGLLFTVHSSYFNFSRNLLQAPFSSFQFSATNISLVLGYVPSPLLPLCQEFWTMLPCTVETSQMGRQESFPCLHILCPSSGWHVMELEPGVSTAIEPKLFFLFNPRLKSF